MMHVPHIRRAIFCALLSIAGMFVLVRVSSAQPRIAAFRPDAAAPGMSVVLEVLAPAAQSGAFGTDGLLPSLTRFVLDDARDSLRVVVGPLQVGWNGRLLQVPIFVLAQAAPGPIRFHITSPAGATPSDTFFIQQPQHLGVLTGDVTLGDGAPGIVTKGNTLVVDSFIAKNARITLSLRSIDSESANRRYQPLSILARGPVRVTTSEFSVSARGTEGGPGGGGGGSGHAGVGGAGYTGGGNSSSDPSTNIGSGGPATDTTGGPSLTGIFGGESEKSDQGGGGGTGHPFGTSGRAGIGADTSRAGGYGGGSAGGEQGQIKAYGGGGGGFGAPGQDGDGVGANGGHAVGGRFLVPLAGGSGGGAGNALNEAFDAGSGGGGGGAIAIVTFDSLIVNDAIVSASADSGTSGMSAAGIAAGGGGGAGGAVLLETARGGTGNNLTANVEGGLGGNGGSRAGKGGDGGRGRIRLDGPVEQYNNWTIPTARGISTNPDTAQRTGDFVEVVGVPSSPQVSSDTVRIFYRTRHTQWQFVDTVRYVLNGPLRWSKWLPAYHDSLLFVAAYAKTLAPDRSAFNYEPDWIPSHVSLTTVRHVPSSNLVIADSVWLGRVRRTHCADTWIRVENRGELPLIIDSAPIVGDKQIHIQSALPKIVAPYSRDSILVTFCPDSVRGYAAILSIHSNDSVRAVTLAGEGLERSDTLTLRPSALDFSRVRVGSCDSLFFSGYTKGTDTVYILHREFGIGAFSVRLLSKDTAVAPGDTARFVAYFCASDTGAASAALHFSERGDSLRLNGYGVLGAIALLPYTDSMHVCGTGTVTFADTLQNVGNDTAELVDVRSRTHEFSTDIVRPTNVTHAGVEIEWQSTSTAGGVYRDTIDYVFSDTTITRIIRYRRSVISLDVPAAIAFGPLCLSSCDSLSLRLTNAGADTVTVIVSALSDPYSVKLDTVRIAASQSDSLRLHFCPSAVASFVDTLHVSIRSGECEEIRSIALSGSGTVSQVVIDAPHFDSVIVSACATDSVTISNPCGPDLTIVSASIAAPFMVDASELPITIPSRGHRKIAVVYCPTETGEDSASLVLQARGGDQFSVAVMGIAFDTSRVVAHLAIHLTPITVIAGDRATMSIELDSSNVTGIHTLSAAVTFDPFVVQPAAVHLPFTALQSRRDTLRLTATLDLTHPGVLGTIEWLGLLGPSSESAIHAVWNLDSLIAVTESSTTAHVIDCSGLSGKIVAAGEYALGQVYPNPSTGAIHLPVLAGTNTFVNVTVYNSMGGVEVDQRVAAVKGLSILTIPTEALTSGVHRVVVSVPGWRDFRSILVVK